MPGIGETSAVRTGLGSGLTAVFAAAVGLLEPVEALCLAAGAGLALAVAAGGSKPVEDTLYPAHLRLARFRRDDEPADVLVVTFPPGRSISARIEGRRRARTAGAVLRVTDGVSPVPSLRGRGLCAVLEPDPSARAAIQRRLSKVCGSDVRVGWASCPDDAVTLDSLVAIAVDRASDDSQAPTPAAPQRLRPQDLLASTLNPGHASVRRTR
jgi:hypothetical protein